MTNIVKAASAAAVLISAVGAFWMTDPSFAYSNPAQIVPALQGVQTQDSQIEDPSTPVGAEKADDSAQPAAVTPTTPPVESANIATPADIKAIEKKAEAIAAEIDRPRSASSLAALVKAMPTNIALTAEQNCLAGAVFFESKSETLAGQLAVARVVINRAKSGRFPKSLCGVVYQPRQFSFVRGRSMPYINKAGQQWKNAVAITQIAMDNSWKSNVEGALFFHAKYVSPGWKLRRVAQIDNHIFYR